MKFSAVAISASVFALSASAAIVPLTSAQVDKRHDQDDVPGPSTVSVSPMRSTSVSKKAKKLARRSMMSRRSPHSDHYHHHHHDDYDYEYHHGHHHKRDHDHDHDHKDHHHHDKRMVTTPEEVAASIQQYPQPNTKRHHHDHYHGHYHGKSHRHGWYHWKKDEVPEAEDPDCDDGPSPSPATQLVQRSADNDGKGHRRGRKGGKKNGKTGKVNHKGKQAKSDGLVDKVRKEAGKLVERSELETRRHHHHYYHDGRYWDEYDGERYWNHGDGGHYHIHSHNRRSSTQAGVPGFVEVATPVPHSALAKTVAGLVYSVNPDRNGTGFDLGTSDTESTQFYLAPLDGGDGPAVYELRVPILDSSTFSTVDHCATFSISPPGPLSLQRCGFVSGASQTFSYDPVSGRVEPLYTLSPPAMFIATTDSRSLLAQAPAKVDPMAASFLALPDESASFAAVPPHSDDTGDDAGDDTGDDADLPDESTSFASVPPPSNNTGFSNDSPSFAAVPIESDGGGDSDSGDANDDSAGIDDGDEDEEGPTDATNAFMATSSSSAPSMPAPTGISAATAKPAVGTPTSSSSAIPAPSAVPASTNSNSSEPDETGAVVLYFIPAEGFYSSPQSINELDTTPMEPTMTPASSEASAMPTSTSSKTFNGATFRNSNVDGPSSDEASGSSDSTARTTSMTPSTMLMGSATSTMVMPPAATMMAMKADAYTPTPMALLDAGNVSSGSSGSTTPMSTTSNPTSSSAATSSGTGMSTMSMPMPSSISSSDAAIPTMTTRQDMAMKPTMDSNGNTVMQMEDDEAYRRDRYRL